MDIQDDFPENGLVGMSVELKKDIRTFLETLPFDEVAPLLDGGAFDDAHLEKMWTKKGFTNLITFIKRYPYKDIKPLMTRMVDDKEVKYFAPAPAEPAKTKTEE